MCSRVLVCACVRARVCTVLSVVSRHFSSGGHFSNEQTLFNPYTCLSDNQIKNKNESESGGESGRTVRSRMRLRVMVIASAQSDSHGVTLGQMQLYIQRCIRRPHKVKSKVEDALQTQILA